jgi:hypothetical protein
MDLDEAIEHAEETIRLIDEDVPEWAANKAPEFFEDIRSKLLSVLESLRGQTNPTPRQCDALEGWRSGVEKWIK